MELAMTWTGEPFEAIEALGPTHQDMLDAIDMPTMPTPEQIRQFKARLLEVEQVECGNVHHFAPGIYLREGRIPAGVFVAGRKHATEHLNILAKGKLRVWTDEGMQTLEAPAVIKSRAGTERVAYTYTDVVWLTVHATDETDVSVIESLLLMPELPAIEGERA